MKLEYLFYTMAVVLCGAAALLFWQKNSEWAFAAGVLAICTYFIGVRFRIKPRVEHRKAELADIYEAKAREEERDQDEDRAE